MIVVGDNLSAVTRDIFVYSRMVELEEFRVGETADLIRQHGYQRVRLII